MYPVLFENKAELIMPLDKSADLFAVGRGKDLKNLDRVTLCIYTIVEFRVIGKNTLFFGNMAVLFGRYDDEVINEVFLLNELLEKIQYI